MSCDAAAAAVLLRYAALIHAGPPGLDRLTLAAAAPGPNPLLRDPLFQSIATAAASLQGEADGLRRAPGFARDGWRTPAWEGFKGRAARLADLDGRGHDALERRGADGDLKCILRGIGQDLPRKLQAVEAADTPEARLSALDELYFLLRDNAEVITTPPRDTSTDVARPG
jgi:hypothetical protein